MKNILQNWLAYIFVSFNPVRWAFISILFSFCLDVLIRSMQQQTVTYPNVPVFISSVNIFLFMLLIRIGDDFRDLEIDKAYYPDRPLASGKISFNELWGLKVFVFVLLFGINLFLTRNVVAFFIIFLLFWLLAKGLFLNQLLSKNRLLALIAYLPVYFLILIVTIQSAIQGHSEFDKNSVLIALWILLPGVIQEIARKTRSKHQDEDGYQSYSRLLGYRKTILLLIALLIVHLIIILYAAYEWSMSAGIINYSVLSSALFILYYLFFLVFPPKKSSFIQTSGSVYWTCSLLGVAVIPVISVVIAG